MLLFNLVSFRIFKITFKVEMSKEKINFIKKNEGERERERERERESKVQKYTNKVQKYNFLLKTKQEKELFTLNMFPKNRQNKLRQTEKNDIKQDIYLNYRTIIK